MAHATATANLQVNVVAPLTITSTSLPTATVGVAYSFQLTASGGVPPYTWSTTGPGDGLSCSSSGLITGTPVSAGTAPFTVTVTDSAP